MAEARAARDAFESDTRSRIGRLRRNVEYLSTFPTPWTGSRRFSRLTREASKAQGLVNDREVELRRTIPTLSTEGKKQAFDDLQTLAKGGDRVIANPRLRDAADKSRSAAETLRSYRLSMHDRADSAEIRLGERLKDAEQSLKDRLPEMSKNVREEVARTEKYRQRTRLGLGLGGLGSLVAYASTPSKA